MSHPVRYSPFENPRAAMQDSQNNRMCVPEIAPRLNIERLTRLFSPSELDLDDLAEAIRSLLGPTSPPPDSQPRRRNPDLLSLPRRGTHVVEATGTS